MNSDGSGLVRLTHDDPSPSLDFPFVRSVDMRPSWSPDGKQIAFSSARDNVTMSYVAFQIFVMDVDGSHVTVLTDNANGVDDMAAWSPDGKKIAYVVTDRSLNIYVMDADGSNDTAITINSNAQMPAWSPDGKKIAYVVGQRGGVQKVYVMNADGSDQKLLTDDPRVGFYPDWSPDGTRIAFASDQSGDVHVYVMNADGSNIVQLTNSGHINTTPNWQP